MHCPWLNLGQEKKWGNSIRGRPTGKFCFDCLSVLISLFPDSDPEEMANKYHSDPICKREVDAAMKIFVELEERNFQAQSHLQSEQQQGHKISFRVAFVAEGDLVRHLQVTPKSLKLQEHVLNLEQLGQTMKGYVLSMRNLPQELLDVCHEIEVFSTTTIALTDSVLDPSRMLSEQQPMRLFQHLATAQAERNPSHFRCTARSSVPTFAALQDKAQKVLEAMDFIGCPES